MNRHGRSCWIAVALLLGGGCALVRPPPKTEAELDEARRSAYLTQHPETVPEVAQAIHEGKARAGMTQAEVRASLGSPQEQHALLGEDADGSWVYKKRWMATHTSFDRGVMSERQVPAGEMRSILRFKGDVLLDVQVRAKDYASGREYVPAR